MERRSYKEGANPRLREAFVLARVTINDLYEATRDTANQPYFSVKLAQTLPAEKEQYYINVIIALLKERLARLEEL